MTEEITTQQIIESLKHGEKTWRGFKRGLEAAYAFQTLESRGVELEKSNNDRTVQLDFVNRDLSKARVDLEDTRETIKKLISDSEARASINITEAHEAIKIDQAVSQEELDDVSVTLDAVREQVREAEVVRDAIKVEIQELETNKAKALELVTSSLSS